MPIVNVYKEKPLQNAYIGEPTWEPGIYYNSTLGLISLSSDDSNWITIADKNQGANNVLDYGNPFQWGNNYAFPNSGSVGTSSSTVNTSSYGPNNYYSSSTYRTGERDWSNPSNPDLWGDTTNTNIARKGPCDEGFHIPSGADWESLIAILTSWGLNNAQSLNTYLKFPYAGIRDGDGNMQFTVQWMFYTSSSNGSVNTNFRFLQCSNNERDGIGADGIYKTYAMYIRPFKNEAIIPDDTWTALYQPGTVVFNFGDWTDSQWSVWWNAQGTITKTANSIAFSTGTDYSTNYLSQYPIDGTKDFLLEFNANIPSTSVGTHCAGLYNPNISILFQTAWQSSYRNRMRCSAGGQYVADGGANPGTADYFIKKEGNVLTMGWNNTTVYTDNNYSFESEYYLCEQVYNDTLTINTAKLTYL